MEKFTNKVFPVGTDIMVTETGYSIRLPLGTDKFFGGPDLEVLINEALQRLEEYQNGQRTMGEQP